MRIEMEALSPLLCMSPITFGLAIFGIQAIITKQTRNGAGRLVEGKSAVIIGWMRIIIGIFLLAAPLLSRL